MSQTLSRTELLKLARAGAEARIGQLQQEICRHLQGIPGSPRPSRSSTCGTSAHVTARRKPGVRGWTVAQRKAAADRMKDTGHPARARSSLHNHMMPSWIEPSS